MAAMADEMTARALRTAWRQAEQSLYAIGGDVDRYEQAIRLVRAVSDELGDVESTAALVDRWPDAEALVGAASARAGVPVGGLQVDRVAGAAFALRCAALQAQEARKARTELVRAARVEGAGWVVLHESGDPLAGLADPYGSTRMHVGSGLAIVAGLHPDPSDGSPVRTLVVVQLDPETGDLLDDDPGVADLACPDVASLRAGESTLRGLVEQRASRRI
ncbi:hypothetical protein GCM10027062_22540 [Nocardioides hungaricus]